MRLVSAFVLQPRSLFFLFFFFGPIRAETKAAALLFKAAVHSREALPSPVSTLWQGRTKIAFCHCQSQSLLQSEKAFSVGGRRDVLAPYTAVQQRNKTCNNFCLSLGSISLWFELSVRV